MTPQDKSIIAQALVIFIVGFCMIAPFAILEWWDERKHKNDKS